MELSPKDKAVEVSSATVRKDRVREAVLLPVAMASIRAARRFRPDKFASVTGKALAVAARPGAEIWVSSATFNPRPGDLVAVKVLSDNPTYDRLELPSGRTAKIAIGDVIVGALGCRRALRGYVGDVPQTLTVGDELALLNMGGVIGRCTGFNHGLGQPVRLEYLGAVLATDDAPTDSEATFGRMRSRLAEGVVASVQDGALPELVPAMDSPPVVAIAGSCMHAGKTRVATELVRRFAAAGWRVAAGKTSGIACLKDTLEMKDNGALATLSFLDLGHASTVGLEDLAGVARSLIAHLGAASPDVIILELGDGLLGGYNVGAVLDDSVVRQNLGALVFCASDFVGAWGGIELLARRGLVPDVISGAVTDSRMGVDFVRGEFGVPAANAIAGGAALFTLVETKISGLKGSLHS